MTILQFHSKAELMERELSADEEWAQIERLSSEVQQLLREVSRWGRKEERAQNFLRYRFNVASHKELTIGQMKQAIPLLKATVAQCEEFSKRMHEIADSFDTDVVGRGAPWTPWIVRKVGKRRMHQEGKAPNWQRLLEELSGELSVH